MNNKTSIRRIRPVKPTRTEPIHKTKVLDMESARSILKSLYLNLKQAIDQETLVAVDTNGNSTQVAFVMGTTEMRFNLVEGGQS